MTRKVLVTMYLSLELFVFAPALRRRTPWSSDRSSRRSSMRRR